MRLCKKCGSKLIHSSWLSYFDDRGESMDEPEMVHTFTCPNFNNDGTGHENYASYNMDVFCVQGKDEK
jgi:hypothetical protein